MKHLLFFLFVLIFFKTNVFSQTNKPVITNVVSFFVGCNGQSGGTINISVIGGRPPYNFSVNNGVTFQTSNNFSGLKAGTYTIVVRDAINTLSDTKTAILNQPTKVIVSCSGSMPCGATSGTVSANATGGIKPYSFLWNSGNNPQSPVQTNVPPGNYRVIVTDSIGCGDTCNVTLVPQGSLKPKFKVGDSISCGYVFFVDTNRSANNPCSTRYLICSFADQATNVTWYNNQFTYTVTGATTDILFDRANAIKIDSFSLAANNCSKFATDSCKGWYLPSKAELNLIFKNLASKNIGRFAKEGYWSSVEAPKKHTAWLVDFLNGREIQSDKSNKYHVRAICEVLLSN